MRHLWPGTAPILLPLLMSAAFSPALAQTITSEPLAPPSGVSAQPAAPPVRRATPVAPANPSLGPPPTGSSVMPSPVAPSLVAPSLLGHSAPAPSPSAAATPQTTRPAMPVPTNRHQFAITQPKTAPTTQMKTTTTPTSQSPTNTKRSKLPTNLAAP